MIKRTMQEWANFTGCAVTRDEHSRFISFWIDTITERGNRENSRGSGYYFTRIDNKLKYFWILPEIFVSDFDAHNWEEIVMPSNQDIDDETIESITH